jgi:PAS domain S-box-containing protein
MMTDQDAGLLAVYSSIFETNAAFVYRCHNDENYTMQYMHGQVADISGYKVDQIIDNRDVSFVGLTHEDDKSMVFAAVDAAIEQNETWNVLYRLVHKDGSDAWIRERGSAVRDETGQVIYLQGLVVEAHAEVKLQGRIKAMGDAAKEDGEAMIGLAKSVLGSQQLLSILAINGRIEAARIGDAGRGFAVIAEEINQVVQKNAELAQEISQRMAH